MASILYYPLLFFVFTTPLIFCILNIRSPFELPKLTYSVIFIMGLVILYSLEQVRNKFVEFKYNTVLKIFSLYALANTISYFLSVNRHISFWGDFHLPSDSYLITLVFFILAVITLQVFDTPQKAKSLLQVIVAAILVQVIYGFFQVVGVDPLPWEDKKYVFGTQGLTVSYAALIGCLTPFILSRIFYSQKLIEKIALYLLIALINYLILSTSSRTPLVVNWATSFFVLAYFVYHHKQYKSLLKSTLVLIVISASVFTFRFINANSEIERKAKPFLFNKGLETRTILIESGLQAWKEKPLFGYGPETYMFAHKPYQSQQMSKYEYWNTLWIKAHNSLIHVLVNLGLFGFLIFIGIYIYLAFKTLKIFFSRNSNANKVIALSLFASYQLLFAANLTCFNLVATQMIYTLLPVLFSIFDENSKIKKINFYNLKFIKITSIALLLVSFFTIYNTFNYWYSDVLFQKSEIATDKLINNVEAMNLLNKAISTYPQEPSYYCSLAKTYTLMLINNKNNITPEVKTQTTEEIKKNINTCLELAGNNYKMQLAVGTTLNDLFFNKIVDTHLPLLQLFENLKPVLKKNPWVYLNIGIVNLELGKTDIFISQMEEAIKAKSDYLPAYIELFTYYYKNKKNMNRKILLERFKSITFYSSEYVVYINHLIALAKENSDRESEIIFTDKFNQYAYLLEI